MSTISVGYCLDLAAFEDLPLATRLEAVESARRDLSKDRDSIENEVSIIQHALRTDSAGMIDGPLSVAFRWLCTEFGTAISTSSIVYGVHTLELQTKLLDGVPPLGFPAGDENVMHLTAEEVIFEQERFADCVSEAQDEELSATRFAFMEWLEFASIRKSALVVIET